MTSPDPPQLLGETRLERRLDAAVARATTPRGAAVVIAIASIVVTVGAGILMTVAEHERYPSIGSGLWWAIQTTTTVGYGDNVPENVAGRLVAAFVMLFGIGFLTVITAAITSTFVARSAERRCELRSPDSGTTPSARRATPAARREARTDRSRPDPSRVGEACSFMPSA